MNPRVHSTSLMVIFLLISVKNVSGQLFPDKNFTDPSGTIGPASSPSLFYQNTVEENMIKNTDISGFSFGFLAAAGFTFGLRKQCHFNLSLATGISWKKDFFMGGTNVAINLYSGGLGTRQAVTKKMEFQGDFILSPSITIGDKKGDLMPLYTFNSVSLSGVFDNYKYNFTLGQNFVFNTSRRHQRVASFGFRINGFSVYTFNDVRIVPILIGDGDDRWWTGGIQSNVLLPDGNILSFGSEVFTGRRTTPPRTLCCNELEEMFGSISDAQFRYPVYHRQPSRIDYELNNGRTFIKLTTFRWDKAVVVGRVDITGRSQMQIQNFIHDNGNENHSHCDDFDLTPWFLAFPLSSIHIGGMGGFIDL